MLDGGEGVPEAFLDSSVVIQVCRERYKYTHTLTNFTIGSPFTHYHIRISPTNTEISY
jgi:hypothetical protein